MVVGDGHFAAHTANLGGALALDFVWTSAWSSRARLHDGHRRGYRYALLPEPCSEDFLVVASHIYRLIQKAFVFVTDKMPVMNLR